jgi:hypothetical protein
MFRRRDGHLAAVCVKVEWVVGFLVVVDRVMGELHVFRAGVAGENIRRVQLILRPRPSVDAVEQVVVDFDPGRRLWR